MDPRELRTFLSVFRELSFSRAADALFISQPAVSRQVQRLERELGASLFERLGHTVHPTDCGRTLAPLAEQILGQIDRARETVCGQVGANAGRLRIGASTTPGLYLLPPVLGRFHRRYPVVELTLSIENSLDIEQRVLSNDLDLGFIGAHLVNKALRMTPVAEDEIVCISGSSHPLADRQKVNPKDLRDVTWIVREPGSATRQLVERWLRGAGIRMRRTIEIHSPEGIKALVAAGIGLSFMSVHGIRTELRTRRLRRIKLPGHPLRRPLLLVRHPDKHVSPAIRDLLSLLSNDSA